MYLIDNDKKLYDTLRYIINKNHMDNYNYETRIYSKGYIRAMKDIEKILDSFIKEYENLA